MPIAVQHRCALMLALLPKVLIGVCFALLSGCGGGGGSDPSPSSPNPTNPPNPPGNPTSSETIGDTGGEISSPDGQMLIRVPAGALDADTVISIEEVPLSELPAELDGLDVTRAYDLQPDGLTFNVPVEVVFEFNVDQAGDGFIEGPIDLSLFNLSADGLEILEDASLTVTENVAQAGLFGRISHFSLVGLIGDGFDDLVKISGVPDVARVGQPFDVTVSIFHRDTSSEAADSAVFVYPLGDPGLDVAEESKGQFSEPGDSLFPTPFYDFGEIVPQVEKSSSLTVQFVCKREGLTWFKPAYYYITPETVDYELVFLEIVKVVACVDNKQPSVKQVLDNTDPEATLRAEWGFGALPNTKNAVVGDSFEIKLFQNGPLNTTPPSVDFFNILVRDTNPGVVTDLALADPPTGLGTDDVSTRFQLERLGEDLSLFRVSESPLFRDLVDAISVDGLAIKNPQDFFTNEQFLTYACLQTGSTQIVFDLIVADLVPGFVPGGDDDVALEIARAGLHVNINCLVAEDDDGEGDRDRDDVGDARDLCPDEPGASETGCASDSSNGQTLMGCQSGGSCTLDGPNGSCSQCGVRRLDDDVTLISDSPTATISVTLDDVYEATGPVTYATDLVSGAFGEDTESVFDDLGISCLSDESGDGCEGLFSNGEVMGCPSGERCQAQIILGQPLTNPTPEIATVDIRKATVNGEGAFDFDWALSRGTPAVEEASSSFSIATSDGAGTSMARLYFPEGDSDLLSVSEAPGGAFTLGGITCSDPLASIDLGNAAFETATDTDCTFSNEIIVSTVTQDLPGLLTGPLDVNVVPQGAWGLSPDLPLVSIGTNQGPIVLNIDSNDFQTVGQDSTDFSAFDSPTDGALVLINEIVDSADVLSGFGQSPTISFQYDPVTEQFSGGVLSFTSVNDMSYVGEGAATSALRVSDNSIDALIPDENNPIGGLRARTVAAFENLTDLANPVVSGYAHSLGLLECYNPCGGSGSEMPATCAEFDPAIAQVIDNQPSCASFWTPTSCADAYSALSGNICDAPLATQKINFGGMVLGVTGGQDSEVFLADPAWLPAVRAEVVGISGDDARDLQCAGDYCVIANFGSSTVTLVSWDGLMNAQLVDNFDVGAGAKKIDMIATPSEDDVQAYQIAVSTSLSDSYHVIVLGPDGALESSEARDLPATCMEPAGVAWVTDFEVMINCSLSDNYVIDRPFD